MIYYIIRMFSVDIVAVSKAVHQHGTVMVG